MVMEYMDHDLKSLMDDKTAFSRPFSVAEAKCLMKQVRGVVHEGPLPCVCVCVCVCDETGPTVMCVTACVCVCVCVCDKTGFTLP